jgi:hypothetical protein
MALTAACLGPHTQIRTASTTLHSLLDYDEEDDTEASFELGLCAEAMHELLMRDYAAVILQNLATSTRCGWSSHLTSYLPYVCESGRAWVSASAWHRWLGTLAVAIWSGSGDCGQLCGYICTDMLNLKSGMAMVVALTTWHTCSAEEGGKDQGKGSERDEPLAKRARKVGRGGRGLSTNGCMLGLSQEACSASAMVRWLHVQVSTSTS